MFPLPFAAQHPHFINLRFKSLLQIEYSLSRQYEKLTFLVSFGCRVTLEMMSFLEDVSISEVGAFDVCDEGHEMGV